MLLLIACCQRIFKDDGDGKRPLGRFIAHGGSSSPKLCTSHTDAADVLCSGLKHPGRPAFPEVSAGGGKEIRSDPRFCPCYSVLSM